MKMGRLKIQQENSALRGSRRPLGKTITADKMSPIRPNPMKPSSKKSSPKRPSPKKPSPTRSSPSKMIPSKRPKSPQKKLSSLGTSQSPNRQQIKQMHRALYEDFLGGHKLAGGAQGLSSGDPGLKTASPAAVNEQTLQS